MTLQHRVHHRAPVGPQHATVIMHEYAGGELHCLIDQPGGEFAKQRVLAQLADRADHLGAFFDLDQQIGDLLGRVLQIGIQRDDDLSS